MAEYCDVEYTNGRLLCHLPITTPTGKARVKRGDNPVATRTTPLSEGDVIEWQISYFAAEQERMVELGKLLELAYRHNIVRQNQLITLLSQIRANKEFFAERYSISVDVSSLPEDFCGFNVLKKVVPVLQKSIMDVSVWIELRHKQRAVGFQPMLYLLIPVQAVSPSLIGRIAEPKQIVLWEPPLSVLFATVIAFSIASRKHHNDMLDLLTRILSIGAP